MTSSYLQLRRIAFSNQKKTSEIKFFSGVNVVCGASDTGKSFLAESIDFMLGGSELRDIPERKTFNTVELDLDTSSGESWRFYRSVSAGHFKAQNLLEDDAESKPLKQKHAHYKSDNMSGFLLDKIGLLGRRILRSKIKSTTLSLSFRNLARLVIVEEGEIQQSGSPFWSGQFIQKTPELATIKLLLTGTDDSGIVEIKNAGDTNKKQIELIDELLSEIEQEIVDIGAEESELKEQFGRLEKSIDQCRNSLDSIQAKLNELLSQRRVLLDKRRAMQGRVGEITDLLARFDLLSEHYSVDIERLAAIQETGAIFAHVEPTLCPLCGAAPEAQQHEADCDGNVEAIVQAATSEIQKIIILKNELQKTKDDLTLEATSLAEDLLVQEKEYEQINNHIQRIVAPSVSEERASYSDFIDKRAELQKGLDIYTRIKKLQERKGSLEQHEEYELDSPLIAGLPASVAHDFSLKVSTLLKAWAFPGDCLVHYDKESIDFVIDGKPRGSRGKGLRAITHAAITIALLEYCQENGLPHPGFVVLDSPLLAYFKPEGADDKQLQSTDLKERFYSYLVSHHSEHSQIIIIENQHPPETLSKKLNMTVFTGNPNEGREGFL